MTCHDLANRLHRSGHSMTLENLRNPLQTPRWQSTWGWWKLGSCRPLAFVSQVVAWLNGGTFGGFRARQSWLDPNKWLLDKNSSVAHPNGFWIFFFRPGYAQMVYSMRRWVRDALLLRYHFAVAFKWGKWGRLRSCRASKCCSGCALAFLDVTCSCNTMSLQHATRFNTIHSIHCVFLILPHFAKYMCRGQNMLCFLIEGDGHTPINRV